MSDRVEDYSRFCPGEFFPVRGSQVETSKYTLASVEAIRQDTDKTTLLHSQVIVEYYVVSEPRRQIIQSYVGPSILRVPFEIASYQRSLY